MEISIIKITSEQYKTALATKTANTQISSCPAYCLMDSKGNPCSQHSTQSILQY